jgi:hypothetical protein
MARVNTMSVFEVKRITVRWVAELNHYDVILDAGEHGDKVTINAWGDHGEGPAPELIVEAAPLDPPNEEMDI